MNQNVYGHGSKQTKDDWTTPQAFFDAVNDEFHFTLDVCASKDNAKCARFFDIAADGLVQDWGCEVCWCNPPYGRAVGKWMQKAYEASRAGATVVCLTFAKTDTRWFHDWVYHKAELRFVKGRLRFGDGVAPAPWPSMLSIYRPH